jgi:hypothetical protein
METLRLKVMDEIEISSTGLFGTGAAVIIVIIVLNWLTPFVL